MSHTLVALMQDRPGVLHRAVSLFRRRGYNIDSLAVGRSETAGVSRMTLVVDAGDVEQVVKQLHQMIEVLKVTDVTGQPVVERESILVKVDASPANRASIFAVADAFEARAADVGTATMIVELSDTPVNVEGFISALRPFGIREMMRSGRIVMTRGVHTQREHHTRGNAAGHGTGNGTGNVVGRPRPRRAPADGMSWPVAPVNALLGSGFSHAPTDPSTAQADGIA